MICLLLEAFKDNVLVLLGGVSNLMCQVVLFSTWCLLDTDVHDFTLPADGALDPLLCGVTQPGASHLGGPAKLQWLLPASNIAHCM